MAEATDTFGILQQNLLDAGCDSKTVNSCMDYAKKGEWNVLPSLLKQHRKILLERLHTDQQQICMSPREQMESFRRSQCAVPLAR
ncbi:hypothetical protein AALB53_19750 [Lachnospiraceae bacterium 47-T17]